MDLLRKWEKLETKGENYSPRTGFELYITFYYVYSHTVVENNGNLYLFAGADSDSRTNDLYMFSIGIFVNLMRINIENKKWVKFNPSGISLPTSRSGAHSLSF